MPKNPSKALLLGLAALFVSVSGQTFEVNVVCGPCQTRTGCLNGLCLRMSGGLADETCYGQATCFNGQNEVKKTLIALCNNDFESKACPSRLCIYGANT